MSAAERRCRRCKGEMLPEWPGATCPSCAEGDRAYLRARYRVNGPALRARQRDIDTAHRERCREQGICYKRGCGEPVTESGYCAACREMLRDQGQPTRFRRRARLWLEKGNDAAALLKARSYIDRALAALEAR